VSNIVPSNNNSSLSNPRAAQSFSIKALDGNINAGYRIETFENGYKEQFVANVGGKNGVTMTYEKSNYTS
jgi:hypothetical protein